MLVHTRRRGLVDGESGNHCVWWMHCDDRGQSSTGLKAVDSLDANRVLSENVNRRKQKTRAISVDGMSDWDSQCVKRGSLSRQFTDRKSCTHNKGSNMSTYAVLLPPFTKAEKESSPIPFPPHPNESTNTQSSLPCVNAVATAVKSQPIIAMKESSLPSLATFSSRLPFSQLRVSPPASSGSSVPVLPSLTSW